VLKAKISSKHDLGFSSTDFGLIRMTAGSLP